LKLDVNVKSVIVGAGRLGSALANYDRLRKNNMQVLALFDVDAEKVGKIWVIFPYLLFQS